MTLLRLSLRNLMRQKKRNSLLGLALVLGMMMMVLALSFANGISDVLFNQVIVKFTGHISVKRFEDGRIHSPIIRDKTNLIHLIRENVSGIKSLQERIFVFTRAIGKGRSDNLLVMSSSFDREFYESFTILEGEYENFLGEAYNNPIMITADKARYLRVGLFDEIPVRFRTLKGQFQTETLTVATIIAPNNIFMDFFSILPIEQMRVLNGLDYEEAGIIDMVLEVPKSATKQADVLHAALVEHYGSTGVLPRTRTTSELQEKLQSLIRESSDIPQLDIQTMDENASDALMFERVFTLLIACLGLVIFLIILIGIVNTLNMTVRERTREVGTLRALGMQSWEIQKLFLLEMMALAFISCVLGSLLAWAAMLVIGAIPIHTTTLLGIFLVEGKLHFVSEFRDIVLMGSLILLTVMAAAYLPTRRAAKLSIIKALGTYD